MDKLKALAAQTFRVLKLMCTGRVRQSVHTAVSDEGKQSWILLIPFQLLMPLCFGVVRYNLLPGTETAAQSFLRTGLVWLELYSLLVVLMSAAALLTRSGMSVQSAVSLIFASAFPLSVLCIFAAACSIVSKIFAMPLILLGLCIMLILTYMGFESACVAAKKFGFGWFCAALFLFLFCASLLLPQLL